MHFARNALIYVILIAAFGIFLPWQKGLDFFDPVLLAAYACMGVIFAGPVAAQAFVNRPDSMAQALRRILIAVCIGEGIALAMLLCGLATVRLTHTRLFFLPDIEALLYSLLFGLAATISLAALAAWVAVQFSASTARMVMRGVYFTLLVIFFFRSRWLPGIAATGAIVAACSAAVFLFLLRSTLKHA